MTAKDKARIRELHAQGLSLRKIAAEIGVSYNAVWLYLQKAKAQGIYTPNARTIQVIDRTVFPNLAKWIIEHEMSISKFCKGSGLCIEAFRQAMVGKTEPGYGTICKVLNFTGMTFEEAFFRGAAGE